MSTRFEKLQAQRMATDYGPTQPWHRHLVSPTELEVLFNAQDALTPTCSDLLDRAVQMLKDRGPMKAKKLADALELPNARSLSMQLQWAHDRCRCEGGKWKAV